MASLHYQGLEQLKINTSKPFLIISCQEVYRSEHELYPFPAAQFPAGVAGRWSQDWKSRSLSVARKQLSGDPHSQISFHFCTCEKKKNRSKMFCSPSLWPDTPSRQWAAWLPAVREIGSFPWAWHTLTWAAICLTSSHWVSNYHKLKIEQQVVNGWLFFLSMDWRFQ